MQQQILDDKSNTMRETVKQLMENSKYTQFNIYLDPSLRWYSKTCVKGPPKKRQNKDPYDKWRLNEG